MADQPTTTPADDEDYSDLPDRLINAATEVLQTALDIEVTCGGGGEVEQNGIRWRGEGGLAHAARARSHALSLLLQSMALSLRELVEVTRAVDDDEYVEELAIEARQCAIPTGHGGHVWPLVGTAGSEQQWYCAGQPGVSGVHRRPQGFDPDAVEAARMP